MDLCHRVYRSTDLWGQNGDTMGEIGEGGQTGFPGNILAIKHFGILNIPALWNPATRFRDRSGTGIGLFYLYPEPLYDEAMATYTAGI